MADKPLLIFPSPISVQRVALNPFTPTPLRIKPTRTQQAYRISPKFEVLETFISAERGILQTDSTGIEPEMVLVFETRGSIDNFFNCVKKMPEFEWLVELDTSFESDEIFEAEDNKPINGKLFFIFSNYTALQQLKSLWENYYIANVPFERGFTKWRDLFDLLYDVRLWNSSDRINDTGILEDLNYSLNVLNSEVVTFEVELWFRNNASFRTQSRNKIETYLAAHNAQIINECIIIGIQYHALLISAPISLFSDLRNLDNIELFKYQEIMYVRPRGQCVVPSNSNESVELNLVENDLPVYDPLIALLDGMPLQNHPFLSNRLLVDDPDNFQDNYLSDSRNHGTQMASMIIYGDLNGDKSALKSILYVRPIMKLFNRADVYTEEIPDDILIVDLVHRAVTNIIQNNLSIKVINLSIGDSSRVFDNVLSPLSKLLDWLSFEHNIIFVISAGNYSDHLLINNIAQVINDPVELEKAVIALSYSDLRKRKIISPGESINNLTIGSSHDDFSTIPNGYPHINFHSNSLISSPISRMGTGFRRSIKPDVLVPGGRVTYSRHLNGNNLKITPFIIPPGQLSASPRNSAGIHSRGTSNSAALTSRAIAKLYESFIEDNLLDEVKLRAFFPVISKTLVVHSSKWNDEASTLIGNTIRDAHQFDGNEKELISRYIGYGNTDFSRIVECTDKRITLLGVGTLKNEEGHLYKLPIPVDLSGQVFPRSLTVTLSWLSPINASSQLYRKAKLWYDFPSKTHEELLQVKRKYYDHHAVLRGTVQHEIFEGDRAAVILEDSELEIRVNCKEDSKKLTEEIRYCIAVTIEIADSINVDIYEKVKTRISERVPA